MTGLSAVRTISHGGVRLAWRHGAEADRPTDGKIKAPPSGLALVVGWIRQFCRLFAFSCRRFHLARQPFQHVWRRRQTDAAESSLEHA